jgi:hypothetical protein
MKIENIIISGCSFVHGFDLCYKRFNLHPRTNWDEAERSMTQDQKSVFEEKRLSGRLQEIFNCNVINCSWSGESNDYIANSLINSIEENKNDLDPETTLVIAGWTSADRIGFFTQPGTRGLNVEVSRIQSYIDATELEQPQTSDSQERVEIFKNLLGLQHLWKKYEETMPYTTYWRHTSVILLLQQYLENNKYKYCFFNSLPHWPVTHLPSKTIGYDYLIDWKNWYPYKNQKSYDWSWDTHMIEKGIERTETMHPTEDAVDRFSKDLSTFIRKHY